jgi:hypothetical protein
MQKMRKCTTCNLTYEDTMKFCKMCGISLVAIEESYDASSVLKVKRRSGSSLKLKLGIAISFLIAMVIAGILFLNLHTSLDEFCGTWEYKEYGSKTFFKITNNHTGQFTFMPGCQYEGKINWQMPVIKEADSIYLKYSAGKLKGEFISSNFCATHGEEFTYKITIGFKSKNKLLYSIYSSNGGAPRENEAVRINE